MLALLLTAGSALPAPLPSVNFTWSGSASSNWDTTSLNWTDSAFTSGPYNAAIFNLSSPMNVTLTTGISLNGITFGTSDTTLGSNVLTFEGALPTLSVGSGITATINSTLAGTVGITKSGAGTLVLGGTNDFSGGFAVTAGTVLVATNSALAANTVHLAAGTALAANSGTARALANDFTLNTSVTLGDAVNSGGLTISGTVATGASSLSLTTASDVVLSNTVTGAGLTKLGSGKLTLSGANTFAGGLTLAGGTLMLGNNAALGADTLTIAGGTLDASSALTITNALTLSSDLTFAGTANLTQNTGTIALDFSRVITVAAHTLSLGGVISGDGFSLTKSGAGTLILAGANTYSSTTNIHAGELRTVGNSRLASTSGVAIAAGATLSIGGTETIDVIANSGTINLTSTGSILTTGTTGGTLAGTLVGNGGLTKAGGGTTTLNAAGTFTYGGTTTVSGGSLVFGKSNQLPGTNAFTISGGSLDLSTFNQTTGAIAFAAGNLTGTSGVLTASALHVTATAAVTLDALLGGAGSLSMDGVSGTLTIARANTGFIGTTTLTAGTLAFGVDDALPGAITVNGGTFALGTSSKTGGAIIFAGGTISQTSGTFSPDSLTATNTSGSLTLDVTLSGAGTLTMNGAGGTLAVNGANTGFTGATTVTDGTLKGSSADAFGTSTITVNGGTFDLNSLALANRFILGGGTLAGGNIDTSKVTLNSGTVTATLTGGTLTKSTDGTVTLAAVNAFTGGAVLSRGTLTVGIVNALPGDLTFTGGTLTLGSYNNDAGAVTFTSGALTSTTGELRANSFTANNPTTQTVAGILGGSGPLTKNGVGTLHLTGANTFTGATTITAGSLVTASGSLANTTAITLTGGTLNAANYNADAPLIVGSTSSATISGLGLSLATITNENPTASSLNFTGGTDTITLASLSGAGSTLFGSAATITSGGIASGTVGVTGLLTSDISGGTVTAGSLTASAVTGGTTTVTNAAGVTTFNGGTLTVGGIATIGTLTDGTAILTGATASIGTLNGGTIALGTNFANDGMPLSATILTVDDGNSSGIISGANGSIVKASTGSLTLSGANTFGGGATLSDGLIIAGDDAAFGTGTVTFAGAALASSGSAPRAFFNNVILAANLTLGDSATNTGTLTFEGTIDLGSVARTLTTAVDTTFSGEVAGSANLTKAGDGTLTLAGANTFIGSFTIDAGAGVVAAGSLAATSAILVNNNGALDAVDYNPTATLGVGAAATATLSGADLNLAAVTNAGLVDFTARSGTITLANLAGGGTTRFANHAAIGGGISGGTVTVAGDLTADIAAGTVTVGGNATANAISGGTISLSGASATINHLTGGDLALNGTTLSVNDGVTAGVISGTGNLTKTGDGTLSLSGVNSFTGTTTIAGGTLNAATGSLAGTTAVTIAGGGTLNAVDVNRFATLTVTATGTGNFSGVDLAIGAINNEGILNFTATSGVINVTDLLGRGTTNFAADATIANGIHGGIVNVAGTLTSTISDGVVTTRSLNTTSVTGGVVTVTGANDAGVTGTNTVFGGTVRLGDDQAVAAGGLLVTGPATFTSDSTMTHVVASDVTLGGDITIGDAVFTGSLNFSGKIDLGGATRGVTTVTDTTLSGNIAGTGGLTKAGPGILTLSGVNNTFSGATAVTAGTLVTAGDGILTSTSGIAIADGATVELGGNETLHSINNSGTLRIDATLTAAITTGTSTIGGLVAGAGTLVKDGAGTLVVDGANTYTGGTTVNAGTLQVGNATALGAAAVTLNAGVLAAASPAGVTLANPVSVAGDVTLGDAANAGTLTLSGAVDLGAAHTLTTAADVTLSGTISAAGLTKEGSAALNLSGASTITGDVVVNAGMLATGTTTTLGAVNSVTVAAGATLKLNGAETVTALTNDGSILLNSGSLTTGGSANHSIAGSIDGTGALVKAGTGLLTLSGASTFAGTTTLAAGTLKLTHEGALGTSVVTVTGGTLIANANLGNTVDVNAGILKGSGTLGATTIAAGAVLAPGNSPGSLTHASLTLVGGSIVEWQVYDASQAGTNKAASLAAAGTDYDTLRVTGTLDVAGASAANPITIRILSLALPTGNVAGDAVGFDPMKLNHFAFATVGNLAQGASPLVDIFSYDLANFTDSTSGTSDPTRWAMSYESGVLWLTASPQLLSFGVLAPDNAPGMLSIADINLTSRATFEISKSPQIGGYYNDTVEFTGKANLNPAPGSEIAIARYTPTGELPDYGRRFVLFKGVGTPATDPTLVSSYFINPAPVSVVNLDPDARYLVVGPAALDAGATASAYDGLIHNADGLVHRPNEYAVYRVRGASGYVQPGVGLGLTGYVQAKALTLAGQPLEHGGTVYVPVPGTLDPLVARLMTLGDPTLATAMASLEPTDFAAIPATLTLGQRNQTAALYRLLEPRHQPGTDFAQGLQGFFQAAGSNFRTTAGEDAPTFNTNVSGGMAGMMTEVGTSASAGFSFSYSDARSTPLRGGSINGHAYHATAFVSSHLASPVGELFVDAGATFGASHNKSTRKTFLGAETAAPTADSYGAFTRVGTQINAGPGLSFRPYVGLDTSKVNGQGFQETGDLAALKVNHYKYSSTRATAGAGLDWSGLEEGRGWRFSLDVEAYRELGGGKTVDFTGSFADGVEWTTRANVADRTGLRLAPSLNFSPDAHSSYYLNLSLEKAGPTKTTGFELGYRRRF